MRIIFYCLFFVILLTFNSFAAERLDKVSLSDDDFVLFSLTLNDIPLNNSVDSFLVNGQVFFAIEPLLDSLKVKYELSSDRLVIWKENSVNEYSLLEIEHTDIANEASLLWGDDGFYSYISSSLIQQLFFTEITTDLRTLTVNISTQEYSFPYQLIQQQKMQREQEQFSGYFKKGFATAAKKQATITIPDQYRLATMPLGRLTADVTLNENSNIGSVQANFVADLLYHSAVVNLNKMSKGRLVGGLNLSRYKTSPDDYILGLFDSYSFGDISSTGDATSLSRSGLGASIKREDKGYRRENTVLTLSEQALPGWEAELYHNNRFISSTKVPQTGLLLYKDIEIYYGRNEFVIKLYGPYGEKDQIKRSHYLKANPLAKGEFSYGAYALDPFNSVFNNYLLGNVLSSDDDTSASFNASNMGGNIDYGVNDVWQIGLSYTHKSRNKAQDSLGYDDFSQDAIALKNSFSLPGFLLENTLSLNDDGGYLQKSTVTGNALLDGNFILSYDSANSYQNESIGSIKGDFDRFLASYNNSFYDIPFSLYYQYNKTTLLESQSLTNRLSYNFSGLFVNNNLTYSTFKNNNLDFDDNALTGALTVYGAITPELRIGSTINYNPEKSNPILASSNINLTYYIKDAYDFRHNFTAGYRPLIKQHKWNLAYNVGVYVDQFRFVLSSAYQDGGSWNVGANIQFFFGYDYHNNRALFSQNINNRSASLNLHAYLDRQVNGVYDVLDYNLSGVTVPNVSEWSHLTTGDNGRAIIPGVPVENVFRFDADWKNGAQTVRNNYVVYTHQGARVDVNMPFYLSTEFSGFVAVLRRNEEIAARRVTVDLLGSDNQIIASTVTDEDGYYEFINIAPDNYVVKVNASSLRKKGLSSEVIGYNLASASVGGYLELPVILLQKSTDVMDENVVLLSLGSDEMEPLIWDEDENEMQNYFNMPMSSKIKVNPNLDPLVLPLIHKLDDKTTVTDNTVINKSNSDKVENVPIVKKSNQPKIVSKLGFTIQFSAHSTLKKAKAAQQELTKKLGITLHLKEAKNSKGKTYYGTQFGNYKSREEVELVINKLALEKSQYMIKKVEVTMQTEPRVKQPSIVSETLLINSSSDVIVTPVEKNISKITTEGWVIQYGAFKSRLGITLPQGVGDNKITYHLAQKPHDNKGLYYLISHVFKSKKLAKEALNNNGWVVPLERFSNMTKF